MLLCPGDGVGEVLAWVQAEDRDAGRVLFYLHPDVDPREALAAWHAAGLPLRSTWTVTNWRELHKHLGAHWNVRVYDDFRGR